MRVKSTAAAVHERDEDDIDDVDDVDDDDDALCSAEEGGGSRAEFVMPALELKPLVVMSKCKGPKQRAIVSVLQVLCLGLVVMRKRKSPKTKDNRVCVAISLPTGVGESAGSAAADAEGNILEITVVWPSAQTDVQMSNAMGLQEGGVPKIEDYHPQIQGF